MALKFLNWTAAATTVQAAGADHETAPRLVVGGLNTVTGADGKAGMALADKPKLSESCRVYNSGPAPLLVYPTPDGSINGGRTGEPVRLPPGCYALFECVDGPNWCYLHS
ncbi:hypothetical protein [Frigoriglobus tundricola]|uniref:Uncharacterized protein n=1 Tax=Frigoriglobus tundricola TaxID=2774151 RepID=A0A6M5YI54_9BACT|nr:hypothetical protein [Frigoriglobus tundricola]QJW92946.1 hypothetical protein FTUN_0444 [Frigoriglobus tundricola]